eukprot:60099-Pelagomonas_calceolata.AAC.1
MGTETGSGTGWLGAGFQKLQRKQSFKRSHILCRALRASAGLAKLKVLEEPKLGSVQKATLTKVKKQTEKAKIDHSNPWERILAQPTGKHSCGLLASCQLKKDEDIEFLRRLPVPLSGPWHSVRGVGCLSLACNSMQHSTVTDGSALMNKVHFCVLGMMNRARSCLHPTLPHFNLRKCLGMLRVVAALEQQNGYSPPTRLSTCVSKVTCACMLKRLPTVRIPTCSPATPMCRRTALPQQILYHYVLQGAVS